MVYFVMSVGSAALDLDGLAWSAWPMMPLLVMLLSSCRHPMALTLRPMTLAALDLDGLAGPSRLIIQLMTMNRTSAHPMNLANGDVSGSRDCLMVPTTPGLDDLDRHAWRFWCLSDDSNHARP